MEYHKDRFEDFSLMVFKKNRLIALLPANIKDNEVYSHQGLTYGGFLITGKIKLQEITNSFKEILKYLSQLNILKLHLKLMPSFYTSFPSDEIEQLLFVIKAQLIKKNLFSVINLNTAYKIQSNRMEGVKKGVKNKLFIKEEKEFGSFWQNILIPNLKNKHQSKPTHTLNEIKQLQNKFPNHIRQFNVYNQNQKLIGGTTIFETNQVVHVQYISADNDKQFYGTLDFLFYELITTTFKHKLFFDFGTSNIPSSYKINTNLYFWKECFGARGYVQNIYTIQPKKYHCIDSFLG